MRGATGTTALGRYALLEAEGEYYDGMTARPQEVIVKFGESSLTLFSLDDTPITHWALAGMRELDGPDGAAELRLTPDAEGDERLTIRDAEMIAAIRAVCPDLRKPLRQPGAKRRIAFWGAAAVGSVLLIVLVLAPAIATRLAPMIPPAQEEKLGAAVERQILWLIGGDAPARICGAPDGVAALDRLTARLTDGLALHLPLKVSVADVPAENALTAPGGHVLVFSGLIAAASGPEEVAGVLAHEIGHVTNRDPTREALRTAGSAGVLGLLVGDFTGGAIAAAVTEAVLNASYQQDAEARADGVAYEIFARAGLPSSALAAFFERMKARNGRPSGLLSHIASHPDLDLRARRAREADVIGGDPFEPALTDDEWIALQQICD